MNRIILMLFIIFVSFISAACGQQNVSIVDDNIKINDEESIQESADDDFILPESSTKKLTEEEIMQIESSKLGYARNEIYARRGYIFSDEKYRSYFVTKAWYKPVDMISAESLNDIEKYNVNLLKYYEEMWGQNGKNNRDNKQNYDAFKSGEKISVDVNGDGQKENIIYKNLGEAGYSLTVNDIEVENTKYTNLADFIAVVDVDKSDKYKELLISDYGPSSDDFSTFYYFDGSKLIDMGETAGVIEYNEIRIDSSGSFSANTRGQILQTWFFDKYYTLTDEHKIVEIPHEVYVTDYDVFVKQPIKLFTDRNLQSSSFDLVEGQIVKIIGTDDKEWCQIETSVGKKGWFAIEGFKIIRNEGLDASEVFAGLCYAD